MGRKDISGGREAGVGKGEAKYPHGKMHHYTGWAISISTASDPDTENIERRRDQEGRE